MPSSPVRVGVVFGGASGEHAVSIRSAITVIQALREGQNKTLFVVIPLYIDQQGRWWPEHIAAGVLEQGQPLAEQSLPHPYPQQDSAPCRSRLKPLMFGSPFFMAPMAKTAPFRVYSP